MPEATVSIFGIRHHGPGSARSLREALDKLKPDCILIEGPPDAHEILPLASHAEMKPPVALLVYDPEKPARSAYYPFAVFSPEWQAIQHGLERNVPVRFIDLPQSMMLGFGATDMEADEEDAEESEAEAPSPKAEADMEALVHAWTEDPLMRLAKAAGYSDSEVWWEHMVEHRRDASDIFAGLLEAMTALREAAVKSNLERIEPKREAMREAHMRQMIRAAQKEQFARIAVVCGAWHTPALATMPSAKEDDALLKGLPKRKVAATWIPWSYGRLASSSGYGAGVLSPGWYDFLWKASARKHADFSTRWLVKVGKLLRGEDLDASSASIIEAVRLADALAALRNRPLPGLPELNEATQSVLCFGEELPLQLITEKLIVSERLGEVPDETPAVPLAQDLSREQKRLRIPPEATFKQLDLDLRKPNDLDRSRLLHRLNLLDVEWGARQEHRMAVKGTFHELWGLQWQPEFAVALIEAGVWGNVIAEAASAKVKHDANAAADLPALTTLLDSTLLADLPEAAAHLISRLQAVAALAADVSHLMAALPNLANVLRYGNVRKTDSEMVAGVVDGLVARICIGLPGACGLLNDEAAEEMSRNISSTHSAISLLQNSSHLRDWHAVLRQLADSPSMHGVIAGYACRLLLEARQIEPEEAARRFGLALSAATSPTLAAAWVEGFLRQSGLLLLHDESLWNVIDSWVVHLSPDHFTTILPLLRRTFASFSPAERRQMGQRVLSGRPKAMPKLSVASEFDETRADKALGLVAQMLGLKWEDPP